MVTNVAGAVVKRHDYFAFGEDIMGPEGDPRRFTGKERDAETELHYFGARYYRNVWGRFTSVDPLMDLEQNVVDPQGWNRYSYVGNRPTRIVDPDGRGWLSNAVKLVKAIAKGGNIAAEFQGVIDDVNTVFSGESSFGQKVLAAASLATEVVSPVSARDAKGVVQAVVRKGDKVAGATESGGTAAKAGTRAADLDSVRTLAANARTTTDPQEVYRRLERFHGVNANVASERLHKIKKAAGLRGADNLIFDLTGNVYDQSGVWIGSLTQRGG
jgi:RHS repeat-associated protein